MSNWNFYPCDKAEHDNYRLDRACINPQCNKHQLVCTICSENEHQQCNPPSIKSFLTQFRSQLQSPGIDQDNQIGELIFYYDQIQNQMVQALQKVEETINEQKKIIENVIKNFKDNSPNQKKQKQQKEKLDRFEQNMNQENFADLVQEIEDFRTNSNRFQFSIKRTQGLETISIQDGIEKGNNYVKQYINATNSIIEQFKNQNEEIFQNLQNCFSNPEKRSNKQEQSNLEVSFSFFNQMRTPPRVQDKPPTTSDTKNTNRNIQNESGIKSSNLNFNLSSPNQIQDAQIQESNSAKKIFIQNNQQNQTRQSSSGQPPQNQRSTQRSCSPLQNATEDSNQEQIQTKLKIDRQDLTFFETEGQEITKLLFLSDQLIAACFGTKCFIYDLKTSKHKHKIYVEKWITDAAYFESNNQNGILILATIAGKLELQRRTQDPELRFTLLNPQPKQIYQFGNNIILSINEKQKVLVTLGDSIVIKIFQIEPFYHKYSLQLSETGTALHANSEFIYIGCRSYLRIHDMVRKYDKFIDIPETNTIISINTYEDHIVVGQLDRLKVFQRRGNGDYKKINEYITGEVKCINTSSKIPIAIISRPQQLQKQQVFVYDFQANTVIDLDIQLVKVCAVREDDRSSQIGLSQGTGHCTIYTIEQTQLPQQAK
ncbi:unnamed protein product [Paramecium octaurelia]|uniref:Uncharacterized protein n=1 Tax=Paramecium octaurelia TaxID=43137 RepID=A0A8S1XBF1_PAROT|nr:unnamed protein product [Paramecium octaurelia]